jgi:hypothetical protein
MATRVMCTSGSQGWLACVDLFPEDRRETMSLLVWSRRQSPWLAWLTLIVHASPYISIFCLYSSTCVPSICYICLDCSQCRRRQVYQCRLTILDRYILRTLCILTNDVDVVSPFIYMLAARMITGTTDRLAVFLSCRTRTTRGCLARHHII